MKDNTFLSFPSCFVNLVHFFQYLPQNETLIENVVCFVLEKCTVSYNRECGSWVSAKEIMYSICGAQQSLETVRDHIFINYFQPLTSKPL